MRASGASVAPKAFAVSRILERFLAVNVEKKHRPVRTPVNGSIVLTAVSVRVRPGPRSKPCGLAYGFVVQLCTTSCEWEDQTDCELQGDCAPGTTQTCGECGMQTCSESCRWQSCEGDGSRWRYLCNDCGWQFCLSMGIIRLIMRPKAIRVSTTRAAIRWVGVSASADFWRFHERLRTQWTRPGSEINERIATTRV